MTATGAKNYYQAAGYYSQCQEVAGRWGGKLADMLGLAGTVERRVLISCAGTNGRTARRPRRGRMQAGA